MICEQDDPEVLEMFRTQLGRLDPLDRLAKIVFRSQDGSLGGWLYERYTGVNGMVHVHWATTSRGRWLTRRKLEMCTAYMFGQLGCRAAIGEVAASNKVGRHMADRTDFKLVARVDGYFPNDDLLIYKLDRRDSRWLPRGMR